ncbi:hypothetical protein EV359DRAFT_87625 [Lentinula novae-zelandiae]|nr:hypothetical protein EV359DRAFT_87625 [Lentinula novae-zelandiae]
MSISSYLYVLVAMDGNASNTGNSNTNSDQISCLLQSFMAKPNAQALEFMSQNQFPPILLQSFLLSQALSQNSPSQAPLFPAPSSNPTSLQAITTSLLQNSDPSLSTIASLPAQTTNTSPSDARLQSRVSTQSNQAQNLPSSLLAGRPLPPFNENQIPPLASTTFPVQRTMHTQAPSSNLCHAHSAAMLPSSIPLHAQALNIEAQPLPILGSGNTLPPPPPPACRPYSSMQVAGTSDGSHIQHTNHLRLDHASQSLPQNPRKDKRREKAVRPPGLGCRDRVPSINDCISVATGGIEVVTIDILIYLPLPTTSDIKLQYPPHVVTHSVHLPHPPPAPPIHLPEYHTPPRVPYTSPSTTMHLIYPNVPHRHTVMP